jgi:hypothetical protein
LHSDTQMRTHLDRICTQLKPAWILAHSDNSDKTAFIFRCGGNGVTLPKSGESYSPYIDCLTFLFLSEYLSVKGCKQVFMRVTNHSDRFFYLSVT